MFTFFFIAFILVVVGVLAVRRLIERLAQNMDALPVYTEEEILAEMDEVYVERDILTFTVRLQSIPVLVHRLTEAVGRGFGSRQAEVLAHRVAHQRVNDFYQAAYPVEVGGIASDLEFQWCREDDDTVRMAICAVDEVLKFASEATSDLVIENRA